MSLHQRDLLGVPQPDLFGAEPTPPAVFRGDPERVRARLAAILAEARNAERMPWDQATLRLYEMIVPQMSRWLSESEAAEVRGSFATEIARFAG